MDNAMWWSSEVLLRLSPHHQHGSPSKNNIVIILCFTIQNRRARRLENPAELRRAASPQQQARSLQRSVHVPTHENHNIHYNITMLSA